MTRVFLWAGIIVSTTIVAAQLPSSDEKPETKPNEHPQPAVDQNSESNPPSSELSADKKLIHDNIIAFRDAYNAGDADTIAALFAQDAQIITEDGDTISGREAIAQQFEQTFNDLPDVHMEIFLDSLRLLGKDLAVEVGAIRETPSAGETPRYSRYTVLHVKRNGKWLMAMARDTRDEPPTNHERLQPLAWLVGEWLDDGGSSVVRTTCDWSPDGNFLIQEMTIQVEGQDVMHVTQRIGWDPLTKRIRSWVFDSEGGFGEGVWTRLADSWVIKSTGVRAEGVAASATNVIVPTGRDGYIWRMHDRIAGDEGLSALEVKVVRKPPAPADSEK